MSTVSEHVAQTLARHVDNVFGVMGNGNAAFLDGLERATSARFTAVRHEAGAVVAADAYYRSCGRLAAATATYGAGFTNTLTALAEAVQARVPLVLVVGDEPTAGARPWDVDQIALASAVGARTYTVSRADPAVTTTIAIEHALSFGRPAVIAIPYDVGTLDAGELPPATEAGAPSRVAPSSPFAQSTMDEIAAALVAAHRPFLLAGRGAWLADAGPALSRIADLAGAVTGSSALGRGIFERPEFDIGVVGGFGAEGAMALVREADVVVVFGASLNQFTMRFGDLFAPGTAVFQVDVAQSATHEHVAGFVRGDAALVGEAIAERLAASGVTPSGWRETIDVERLGEREQGDQLAADGRLDPRSVAIRIGGLLPSNRVVVSDGGHFIGWANMYWPIASPDRMHMVGTAFQAIGLGWPSVAGAAIAKPDSTVVLTTGDGGGLMALADLETAVRVAGGRGMAVVWNDAAYSAEVNVYGSKGYALGPMLIPEVDFAALATGVGAEGVVVRYLGDLDRLGTWAAEDAGTRSFLVLDCRVSGAVVAPYQEEIMRAGSR
jgi:acetolactate synthase-1/2/3 large subunit